MWDKDSVKKLRQSLELTQIEFAELLGCRQQTISEWEQGLYVPANAYGKLLSQIRVRAPILVGLQSQQIRSQGPIEHKNDQYERPFDPAID